MPDIGADSRRGATEILRARSRKFDAEADHGRRAAARARSCSRPEFPPLGLADQNIVGPFESEAGDSDATPHSPMASISATPAIRDSWAAVPTVQLGR